MAETLPAPEDRGTLVVADRALTRIARAAAGAVEGSVRTSRPRAGLGQAVDTVLNRAYPTAACTRAGNRVRLDVQVAARWPTPAPALADRVRTSVVAELSRLAAVVVDACDVTVAEYVRQAPDMRRVQ
ncbi:Asp23/Gls24 family envelope stress response protein [Kineococcus rhizosphaerae]|uniref:Putative alkaline shock family protein YloU n=1 Tax=Kineococcus rhizosphaerae TaxID=559628 RepID=A0A2T0R149_9ACTN|nr:Asp23/Gls24 family envelope stress response protein [Kineococcus rhizosphaerae]PRY13033.1 putative alkaline shock family protein YloU [Kineococcus rhizosphaerae]